MTFVEREVFAFLQGLRVAGVTPPYVPRIIREFGLSGEQATALCIVWIADERAGMDWWNALAPDAREDWLNRSGTDTAAGAWTFYKQETRWVDNG